MMSGFWSSSATRLSEYLATFSGSKSLNARRYPSRLFEDYKPVEAGLGTLKNKKLKMFAIIACRDAPLMIVITYHQGLAGDGPGASRSRVVCALQAPRRSRSCVAKPQKERFGDVIFLES